MEREFEKLAKSNISDPNHLSTDISPSFYLWTRGFVTGASGLVMIIVSAVLFVREGRFLHRSQHSHHRTRNRRTAPSFSDRTEARSTESTATYFNPDAVSAALVGTWSFPFTEGATGICLLHFTATGRAIQFVFDPQQPEKRSAMRLWYSVESPTDLNFRPTPSHHGWLCGYRFDGSTMTLLADDRCWVCTRPSPHEIPDWFQQSLASALAQT